MNKTKVLVFTSYDKWTSDIAESIHENVVQDVWDLNYPDSNALIKKCVFENGNHRLDDVNLNSFSKEEGVFIVCDEINIIDPKAFQTLKDQCKGDPLYVLTHSNGCQYDDFSDCTMSSFLSGRHNTNPEDHYHAVFEILTDQSDDKLGRIINQVFKSMEKMEMVLRFLHGCLIPKNEDSNFSAILNMLKNVFSKETGVLDCINDFETKYKGACNLKDYSDDLEILRDKLLEYTLR